MAFRIIIGADLVPTPSNYEMFNDGLIEELVGHKLKTILEKADFTIFNLEVPLTDVKSPISKCGPALIAPTSCIAGLQRINRHFFTLANNHIMDQGEQGLYSTIKVLTQNGIAYSGVGNSAQDASKPYIIEKKEIKLGIYCCAEHEFSIASENKPGANPFDPMESFDQIVHLKKQCDFIIVLYHGGKEQYRYPAPYLQKICRKFIDKGASLVVCQHSHCIGCAEQWNNGTIVYGQGNFLFDGLDNEFWTSGLLIDLVLNKNEAPKISYLPIIKKENGVALADEKEKDEILKAFANRSSALYNDKFIYNEYANFSKSMLENYLSVLQGNRFKKYGFRLCNFLSHRKLRKWRLKQLYRKEDILTLINYFECEAHRELFIQGAKDMLTKLDQVDEK